MSIIPFLNPSNLSLTLNKLRNSKTSIFFIISTPSTIKRIVIKVGSALIKSDNKNLINEIILNRIVKEIINLNEVGKEILLVSSGAIALGKKSLNFKKDNLKVSEKQAASSVGQVLLINAWKKGFP